MGIGPPSGTHITVSLPQTPTGAEPSIPGRRRRRIHRPIRGGWDIAGAAFWSHGGTSPHRLDGSFPRASGVRTTIRSGIVIAVHGGIAAQEAASDATAPSQDHGKS